MSEQNRYRTKSGRALTDADVEAIADEVEATDIDLSSIKVRRRGRPAMGSAPAEVVPVRMDPELRAALDARALEDDRTVSEIIREALRQFLHVG